jgi:hypothetical protein
MTGEPSNPRARGIEAKLTTKLVERYAYTAKPTLLFCRGKYMRGEPLIST